MENKLFRIIFPTGFRQVEPVPHRLPPELSAIYPSSSLFYLQHDDTHVFLQITVGSSFQFACLQAVCTAETDIHLITNDPHLLFSYGLSGTANWDLHGYQDTVTVSSNEYAGMALHRGQHTLQLKPGTTRLCCFIMSGLRVRLAARDYPRLRPLCESIRTDPPTPYVLPALPRITRIDTILKKLRNTRFTGTRLNVFYKWQFDTLAGFYQAGLEQRARIGKHRDQLQQLVRDVKRYIHQHYPEEKLHSGQIASAHAISLRKLQLVFQPLGTSVRQYLIMVRMHKARRLLLFTDIPVTDIGTRVGYFNPKQFTDIYRKFYKRRPQDERKPKG